MVKALPSKLNLPSTMLSVSMPISLNPAVNPVS